MKSDDYWLPDNVWHVDPIYIQTSHPQAFVVSRKALKKDYGWIVEMIDLEGMYNCSVMISD